MTKLLEKALVAVQLLPPKAQDEVARMILSYAQQDPEPEDIDSEHLEAVLNGLSQARRREFASPERVEAAFNGFRK
jgi:DNA-binding TFAR19-related protein (PDSD5 family)